MSEPLVEGNPGVVPPKPRAGDRAAIPKTAAGAAISKMISASVGDIIALMARAPSRKHYALSDIEWLVLPPVIARQFYVAEAQSKETGFRAPVAAVTWAKVSADVDKRLMETAGKQPLRLKPDEWTSGEIIWLIDMLGDPRGLNLALKQLMDGPFKERDVKVAVRGDDGKAKIELLAELVARAADQAAGHGAISA